MACLIVIPALMSMAKSPISWGSSWHRTATLVERGVSVAVPMVRHLVLGYDDSFMFPIFGVRLQLSPLFTVASRDLRLSKVEVIDAMRAVLAFTKPISDGLLAWHVPLPDNSHLTLLALAVSPLSHQHNHLLKDEKGHHGPGSHKAQPNC